MVLARLYDDPELYYNSSAYNYNGLVWRSSDGGKGHIGVATTAAIKITAAVSGKQQGGTDLFSLLIKNSSAVDAIANSTATTSLATATPISIPTSGHILIIIPNSTNTSPLRLTGSTSQAGIPVSSQGPSLLCLPGGTTVHVYTTGASEVIFKTMMY